MTTQTDDLAAIIQRRESLMKEAGGLADRIEAEGLTPGLKERSQNLTVALDRATADWQRVMKDRIARGQIHMESGDGAAGAEADRKLNRHYAGRSTSSKASPLADAILDAGFDLRTKASVEFSGFDALKAPTFPAVGDWNRADPVIVPSGQDRRWMWPNMVTENAGTAASIQDFAQTARTLTGTVQRTLNAATDKAHLDVTTMLVNEALQQFAMTINDIPNAVLESVPQFTAFMESEGLFQIWSAIDAHVHAQILAATPPNHLEGTGLIAEIRNGIGAHRAVGANPSLLVVNPTDAATLDLSADAGGYVFPTSSTGTSSPIWGQRVVERTGAGSPVPLLIDTSMLGVLYLGSVRFDADPYSSFKKNLTTLRVEVNGLFHVRNSDGALLIEADAGE